MSQPFRIDPEFQSLMPVQTKEARAALKLMIDTDDRIDPGVVLNILGDRILGDGHTRRDICAELALPFPTVEIKVPSREMAIQWIVDNQLARRNLTDQQRYYYVGRKYLGEKQPIGGQKRDRENLGVDQNEQPLSTAERIAKEQNISPATVRRNAEFAEAVDAMPPEERQEVLNGTSTKTKQEIINQKKPPKPTRRQPSRNGKVVFDDSKGESEIGKLQRFFDARKTALGGSPRHTKITAWIKLIFDEYKAWKKDS